MIGRYWVSCWNIELSECLGCPFMVANQLLLWRLQNIFIAFDCKTSLSLSLMTINHFVVHFCYSINSYCFTNKWFLKFFLPRLSNLKYHFVFIGYSFLMLNLGKITSVVYKDIVKQKHTSLYQCNCSYQPSLALGT